MANENEKEEYKLDEDYSYGEKEDMPPMHAEGSGISDIPKKPSFRISKKLLFVIIAIVIFILIFKIVPIFKSTQPETVAVPQQSSDLAILSAKFASLQQQFSDNSQKISTLQEQLAATQGMVNNLSNAVNNLDMLVKQLTAERVSTPVDKNEKAKVKKFPKIYHVRAIVPGRAWLETANGSTITVRPGSKLGKYGTVAVINDTDGVVVTDKGMVINYGNNDI
jgi:intracellular multiplication protein IcmG